MIKNNLIVITGPTGIGKTSLSIEVAQHYNSEIISCDSRQIYKEMTIGTAVPSKEQLEKVKHHFIQSKSINDYYNASMFEMDVISLLNKLFAQNNTVIMAGGSGLYIDAVCNGIDDIPNVNKEIREKLQERLEKKGLENLTLLLKKLDPTHYSKVDLNNHKRVLKALEICKMTGKPYSSFLTNTKKPRNFNILKIGLNRPRQELYNDINKRVEIMLKEGLVDEARELYSYKTVNALNTVGYKELFKYFDNELILDEAVEQIKNHSRKYARQQLTWFRRYQDINWFLPNQQTEIITYIDMKLQEKT